MAPVLSQSEIQEIIRLLEQGNALPEKYRDILFVERQLRFEDSTAGNVEPMALAEQPIEPPQPQAIETNTAPAFSMTAFAKFLLDDQHVQQMVSKCAGTGCKRPDSDESQSSNAGTDKNTGARIRSGASLQRRSL